MPALVDEWEWRGHDVSTLGMFVDHAPAQVVNIGEQYGWEKPRPSDLCIRPLDSVTAGSRCLLERGGFSDSTSEL